MDERRSAGVSLPARILVVDDDGIIRTLVQQLLEDDGYEVQTVAG
jgi:CheY-like chemotaxis protein